MAEPPIALRGGAGGGHLLQTALSLSLSTGRGFTLTGFRTASDPPGLRAEHLACLRAAETLCGGQSQGAEVGASELSFTPGEVRPGDYLFELPGGGSATVLLQALAFPFGLAGGGTLTFRGVTHGAGAPSYHDLAGVWLTAVRSFGFRIDLRLRAAGFAPEGGGEIRARIERPGEPPNLVDLPARGTLQEVELSSMVAGLPLDVAERQGRAAVAALRERGIHCDVDHRALPFTRSTGHFLVARAQFEYSLAGFTAVGEKGQSPEATGRGLAARMVEFLASGGAIDRELAAELVVPAALVAAGRLGPSSPGRARYTAEAASPQLTIAAEVAQHFLPVRAELGQEGRVEVGPRPDSSVPARKG